MDGGMQRHMGEQGRPAGLGKALCSALWLPSAKSHFHQSRLLLSSLSKHTLCTWAPLKVAPSGVAGLAKVCLVSAPQRPETTQKT